MGQLGTVGSITVLGHVYVAGYVGLGYGNRGGRRIHRLHHRHRLCRHHGELGPRRRRHFWCAALGAG